jgi:hypothetical protein
MDKRKVGAAVRTLYDDALHIFDLLADFSDSALSVIARQCSYNTTQITALSVSDPKSIKSVIFADENVTL